MAIPLRKRVLACRSYLEIVPSPSSASPYCHSTSRAPTVSYGDSVEMSKIQPNARMGLVMSTASSWRLGILLVLASLSALPLHGQVRQPANAADRNGIIRRARNGDCEYGIARFNDVTVVCQQTNNGDVANENARPDGDVIPRTIQITFNQGSLDQVIFGKEQDAAEARRRLAMTLHWKINAIDRTCVLSDDQLEKLRLAGRGDIKRLLDRATDVKARFENIDSIRDVDQFEKWAESLAAESGVLRPLLSNGPFDVNSLFAKALKRTITPEQADAVARLSNGPLDAAAGLRPKLSLDEILGEWERVAARRARLDCDFTRIRYDTKFGIEFRGQGSLAVDRHGRGAYRIEPAEIPRGAPGAKRGPGGGAYELRAESPDRWHWTGISVIRVNENKGTFEEWKLPGRLAESEFQPEPPELPEDVPSPRARRPARNPLAVTKPPPQPASRTALAQQVSRLLGAIMLSRALSKEDFAALIDLLEKFDLAQPFLLGMSVHDLRERFDVRLVKSTDEEVWLEFHPRHLEDEATLHHPVLILESAGYSPRALKTIDATGIETVHVFKNVSIFRSRPGADVSLPAGTELLDRPSLAGYAKAGK
jgi:hypothetical protein